MMKWVWNDPAYDRPADGSAVEIISPSGAQQNLYYKDNLWWLDDEMGMFIYYTPEKWRYL